MILIAAQRILFNMVVFAFGRAAPVGRRPGHVFHAHATLDIAVLYEERRCCSEIDKIQYFAETPEGR